MIEDVDKLKADYYSLNLKSFLDKYNFSQTTFYRLKKKLGLSNKHAVNNIDKDEFASVYDSMSFKELAIKFSTYEEAVRKLAKSLKLPLKRTAESNSIRMSKTMKKFYSSEAGRKSLKDRQEKDVSKLILYNRSQKGKRTSLKNLSSRSITGYYKSEKTKMLHYYRSSYELRAYKLLDADPCVEKYATEPFAIPYAFEGLDRHYYPDILIEYVGGSKKLVEIKPLKFKSDKLVETKAEAAQKFCFENNMQYEFWTEKELFV